MIRRFLLHIVMNAAALYGVVYLMKGDFILNGGYRGYLIAAIILGLLNSLVKPLLKVLSFPFILLSAGLFTLVINSFLVWFIKYALEVLQFQGVSLSINGGMTTYLITGLLLSLANMVIHYLADE